MFSNEILHECLISLPVEICIRVWRILDLNGRLVHYSNGIPEIVPLIFSQWIVVDIFSKENFLLFHGIVIHIQSQIRTYLFIISDLLIVIHFSQLVILHSFAKMVKNLIWFSRSLQNVVGQLENFHGCQSYSM
jgi:hypothetical protein